jgi:hypothetical protein
VTRIRYSARSGGARNHGRAYQGVSGRKASPTPVLVPLTDGLVECPVCHGGVRVVQSSFADPEADIGYKSPVLGSHKFGGLPGGRQDKCAGSHTAAS